MDTGDLTVFHCDSWFSAKHGDKQIQRDIVAKVKGKAQLKSGSFCNDSNTKTNACICSVLGYQLLMLCKQ